MRNKLIYLNFAFRDNPFSKSVKSQEQDVEKLKEEVLALRERIKLMESGDDLNLTQKVGAKLNADAPNSKQVAGKIYSI